MGEVLMVFLGVVGGSVIGLTAPGSVGVVLPLLATQILWLNLITDTWPALAMGVDPATDDVMARPPQPVNARVMNAAMWVNIVETGLLIALLSLLGIDISLPGGLIEGTSDITTARTVGFTTLVFAHLFQSFNARSATHSVFSHLGSNRWLWAATALSGVLQVAAVELPVFNLAFSTAPLSAAQWGLCAALGSGVLWFSEARKLARRARARRSPSLVKTS
jgi:P-type Ca2+ transporter type 2C